MLKSDLLDILLNTHHDTEHNFGGKVWAKEVGGSKQCVLCNYERNLLERLGLNEAGADKLSDIENADKLETANVTPSKLKLFGDREAIRLLLVTWLTQIDEGFGPHDPMVLLQVPLDNDKISVGLENRLDIGFVRRNQG